MWLANVVSNLGTLIQGVGAAWLMTSLTSSTVLVGLVQTAASLPAFLLGMVAGALADMVARKWLLFWSQCWMLVMAAMLGVLTFWGWTSPWVLLGATAAIGVGSAISLPAWQATVQDLVPKDWVAPAVSLNSIGFSIARSVGPAIGGLLVAAAGAAFAFFVNALSFLGALFVLGRWQPAPATAPRSEENLLGAILSGLQYLIRAPHIQIPIVRSVAFNLCGGAVWPLLPLLARNELRTNATGYGLLLAAYGLGSIVGAAALPKLRRHLPLERILAAWSLLGAVALFSLSHARELWQAAICLAFAGMSWVGTLINFNVAVQISAPDAVRGRMLSFYFLAFQGTLAASGALWGYLAGHLGMALSFQVAALGLLGSLLLARIWPLNQKSEIKPRNPQ